MRQISCLFLCGVAACHAFVLPNLRIVHVSPRSPMTLRDQLQAAGPGVAAVSDQELGELDEMVNGEQLGKIMIEIPRTPKSSTEATPSVRLKTPLPLAPASTVVVGGGPAGLATAIMLARRGWNNIQVYDRLPPPPDPSDEAIFADTARFYLVGLSSRGQRALQRLDAWKDVAPYCSAVVGRKDWSPQTSKKDAVNAADSPAAAAAGGAATGKDDASGGGGGAPGSQNGGKTGQGQGMFPPPLSESSGDDEWSSANDELVPLEDPGGNLNIYVDRPYVTQVLARDRLAGALKSVVERDYASQVSLHYEHALVEADWQSEEVTLTFNTAGAGGAAGAPADDSSTSTSTDTSSNNDRSSTESSSSTMVVKAPFVVGADGAVRFVADKLAELEDPSYQQPQQKGQKEKGQELAATNGNGSGTSTSTSPSPSPSPSGGRPAPKAMARLAGRVGTKLARVMGRERPLRIVRYPDDNARVYKTVPLAIPTGAAPPALTAQAAAADAIANDEALEVAKAKEKSARQAAIRARPTGGYLEGVSAPVSNGVAKAATAAAEALNLAKARAWWRLDVNYSARSSDGRVNFDALPSGGGKYCGVLLLRSNDPLAQPHCNPEDLRHAFQEYLPQFSSLVNDETMATVAAKPPSRLPTFRYVGPRVHHGTTTVLLGDAIHSVKPYFGLGANSAFEDVISLQQCLDGSGSDAIGPALKSFSEKRAPEAEALVRISRGFDRPGFFGFLTFVLPLILDGIFHKAFPKVFGPNTIASLQVEGVSFVDIARKKRRDRALQFAILGTALTAFTAATATAGRLLLHALATAFQQHPKTTALVTAATAAAAALGYALAFKMNGSPSSAGGSLSLGTNLGVAMKQRLAQRGTGTSPSSPPPPPAAAAAASS